MNMNLAKRILSLVLMLALLMGNSPAVAFATDETTAATEEVVVETSTPTEAEDETAATELVTEPATIGNPEANHTHSYKAAVTSPTCTEQSYTTYTCECGDSYTSDVVAALGHDFSQSFVCSRCDHVAKVSVLGDSISTYAGFSAVKNAVYPNKTILSVEDTWWKQAVDTMGAQLLVNNASGGSRVLSDEYFNGNGIREGNYAAYRDRCVNLHDGDEKPDVIFVFMGTNDFSYHVDSSCEKCQILLNCSECTAREDGNLNVCSKCRSISGIYSSFCNLPLGIADSVNASAEVPTSVCEAYAIMLSKMKAAYPNAQIYCMGLLPRVNPYQNATYHDHGQPTAFNAELKKVAENAGARFISLEQSVDNSASTWNTYFGDAVHPTAIGMDKISAAVLTDVLGKEIYTVSSQIVSSAVTMTGESWAMDGAAYEASVITLNPDLQLDVRVIMNGVDVTENVFNAQTGRIYIVEVTGNILITVKTEGIFWSIGTINTINGADADDYKNRIRTDYISVNEGVTVRASNDAEINVVYFDANYKILSANNNTGWIKEWTSVGAPTAAAYIRVVARATSGTNLTTEYSQNVTITCGHVHDYSPTVTAPTCTEQGYTTYTCACGDSYVDDYMDATGEHIYENGICTGCGEAAPTLAGKTISILGASMSTYTGISNNPDYNSTIGNNAVYYTEGKLGVYKNDTWWMQAANDLGLRLLVNNSWSGSSLLYERNGTVGAYVDRCVQLHNNEGETPDIIAIQMGTNDFQYYKDTLGTADINYAELIVLNADGSYTYAEPTTSLEAAAIVLHKISIRYPGAEVYYLNISQRIDGTDELIRSFNAELRQVVEHFGAHIVDIYGSAITMADFDTYIGDGRVHPNCLGMDAYTEAFKRALLANTAYEVDTHTVSLDLDGVTANYGDDKIVVSGDAFSCKLTAEDGKELSVSVTMGGEDITDTAYENGTVSIESVTDDVVITAEATVHQSQNYRWEFDGIDLACVSGGNTLSKNSGTTTDGVFSKTSYTLENDVVLLHGLPWVVEWKCEGTFQNTGTSSGARVFTSTDINAKYNARYIFKSNTDGIIAMGEKTTSGSHNYGVALGDYGIDWTTLHTYRLENRISDDGSNMIYLSVDGKEIGPMNHYYVGTSDQNTTSDWLSGKDFVFPYMGTDTHGFTNASIEFIQVWESGKPEAEENLWDGRSAVFVGDSITAGSGTTKIYYEYLEESLGFDSVTAMGVGGSCISAYSDYGTGNQPLINRYQDIPSADIIVIFMGTNDYGHETPLGNVGDTQDGTFCGALNMIISALVVKHPSSKIVFVTPLHRYGFGTSKILGTNFTYDNIPNGVGASLGDYVYALKTVCANNGVSVIDLYTECTLDPSDADVRAEYMPDGLHPNAAGHEVIAGIMESHIRGFEPAEQEPIELTEMVYGNRFATGNNQTCRASSRINYYLKAGTVISLKDSAAMQWACARTSNEFSSNNLGYFPDSGWSDKETAVVAEDGWVGFAFKYRDETQSFDLTKSLSGYITIHTHSYNSTVTAPTCTAKGYSTYTCACGDSYVRDYVDATGHAYENGICTDCGAEDPNAATKPMSMRYDDHMDMTGKTVEIIDAGTPTSYQVGYGVEENTVLDTAVVTLEGNTLVATGIGTAKVKIDGILYEVTVEASPISLLLLIGQSNMRGSEGNADQSIVCPDGMVYSTYGDDRGESNTAMTASNATQFAPSALTGTYSSINVVGTTDCLSGYPVTSLTEGGAGKIGPDSGFGYEWVKQTGEKVWVVNAAHGGTSINVWQPGTTEYEQCQALFTACQETLRKEIAAGHFTLSHMAYFWCQGCSDRTQSAQWYVNKYLAMHSGLKTEMSFDHDSNADTADKTFEFGGIIPVRVGSTATCYRDGVYSVSNPYAYHESFVDLRFSGPRVAQYWMINNPELSDIWGVCDIGDNWVWMPDGINGVSEYFQSHYPNGTVDYTTQVKQSASWYTPTTPKAVHDSVHYNQIGYNEVGRESARNALIMLGENEAPEVETTVELLSWDGYTEVPEILASTAGNSGTLIVPKVYPVWKAKEVTYELSEGLTWNYYDLLATDIQIGGTLSVSGKTVTVEKATPGAHYVDHLSDLPEGVCCGVNLWNILAHDKEFFTYGTHWTIHSSGNVYSVTFPVKPGDLIYATAFGKAGENGSTSTNGIRVTFFNEYGVAKTTDPAGTYKEFVANGGYLIVPEGTTAANIPMWTNDSSNELYILNREHTYTPTVTAPTCTEQGYTTYTCSCGDSYVDDYVDATGEHSYENSICMGCGKSILCEAEFPVDLFVFAGQSNMMGAAVLEPEVDSFTDQAWEYKYMPKLRGAETGSFVPAQNSAGEWYYNDLNAAYGENLYDLTYQSSLSNYSENTYFCPAMSNGTKGFSAQSEANMYPSASLPPYFATEYASYGHSSIYAHMAKGSVKIIHYFTPDMINAYNALITAYNAENNKSYKLLTAADLTGAGNAFDAKYAAMLEDYATCAPDGSINNKCFVWLQGESDGSSYIEYKLKMQVLWEHLQTLGFTHFFVLRVGYWGSTGILDIIKAQEDFCAENENCYIVTRAPSLIPHPSATTDNWWIIEPDAEYADCRDSYTVAGSGNHHFNEKAMQIFAERSADNIHRILYQGLDPILENENIQGMLAEDKPEVDQPEDTSLYSSYVGTEAFYKGLSISKSSDKWVEKSSSTAASTDLIPVASSDSVWIQYVFFLSEAHAVGGFYDKNGELVAPLYYRDFGFSLGGGGGTAAFRTPEATNRISIADIELVTGKEIAFVRFTAWQASAGGHANTEARVYHDYEAVVTTPTCTEQGYTTYTCECGDSYVDSYVDALGHDMAQWETAQEATCTADGSKQSDCTRCDYFETEAIEAKGHTEVIDHAVAPTCTETGLTEGKHCSACEKVLVAQSVVAVLGHEISNWVVTEAPACTETGSQRRDCSRCDYFEEEVIQAKGHEYESVVTSPTCTEQGYTTYTCECGESYVDDFEDATGEHTYENGICTGCGEEDYDGLDLNGLNVLCLGDSITAGQGLTTETRWTNVLASEYGWNLTNKSQGGISLSSYYYTANGKSDVSIAKKAEILKTMTTKPDVIIVWGGHNDTSYRYSPLGTWDDETTDSFKGALKYIAELADEYAPDATLFVLTPLWTTEAPSTLKVPENTTDNNWMFVDAIYEGAEAYGWIPVNMDLCGITPFTKSGLLLDNIHPNEAGTEKIVAYLSAELASYSETSKKETIIFNASAVSMKPGESTTLKAVLSPRSGTGTMTFTWSSSDSSVATVDASGKITAVAPGTAVITATAPNGISADISVSVVCEHTYEPSVTAPTCTEKGYTTYTCECGESYVDDYTDELGHYHATAERLESGEHLVLSDLNVIKNYKAMIFRADVDNLGDGAICLNHGKGAYGGSHLEITKDSLIIYNTTASVSSKTYSHGLHIDGTVKVRIDTDRSSTTVTITTESGTYRKSVSWSGCNGALECSVTNAALNNVDLRWYTTSIDSDAWFFGDSWFSTSSNARWTKYLLDDGYDVLLAGYPGMGAPAGSKQFRSLLELDKPEYAVWALGMNNGDRNGNINTSWQSATEEFLALCEEYGITPILCTIPTTPKVNNRLKNEWIVNSGYRYIDFDLAVVENHTTGEWFEGMAATDLNHPTTLGAQALYPQVFADFPELAKADSNSCQHKMHLMAARNAECENGGRKEYYVCSLCGGAYADTAATTKVTGAEMKLAPNGHSFGAWTQTKAPTCTAKGTERRECANCNHYETREIAAKGHTEVIDKAVAATCTTTGLTEGKHCSVCEKVLVAQSVVAVLGHEMSNWGITEAPTCTETGSQRRDCNRCDYFEEEVLQAKGHEYGSAVTSPTCTDQGYTTHTCTCGDSYADTYVTALGHDMSDWVTVYEPTCTEDGSNRRDCSRCEHFETETISATGHSHNAVVTYPTCTADGFTTHTCHCGDTYTDSPVLALGHDMSNWVVIRDAACTEDGKQCRECGRCDHAETEVIEALGHSEIVDGAVAPTCTETGLTEGVHCTTCGEVLAQQEMIAALGHSWIDSSAVIKNCGRCGHTEGGYRLLLDADEFSAADCVWIDGVEYTLTATDGNYYIDLEHTNATNLVVYTYNDPDAQDIHTQYPTEMKVWILKYQDGIYTAKYIEEFDNLLQYSGSSIRITGNKGIRMITSIAKNNKQALTGTGLAGYTLVEYGTALAWASDVESGSGLILGQEYTKSNYAYKKGVADPVFAATNDLIQYTNVLVGFSDDQCIPDIAMRPYIILEDAGGNQITLYGGVIYRSIGYVAYQNRNVVRAGTAAYSFVWDIIHHVYGDRYDSDYKG